MKEFFLEFFKFLSDSVLIICFALVSFLLILNFYHYRDVSYKYPADLTNNAAYNDVISDLKSVDKKMNSVNYKNVDYNLTAKPIFEYYTGCKDALEKSVFYNLSNDMYVSYTDVYNANNDLVNDYNNVCLYTIAYSIANMDDKFDFKNDYTKVFKLVEEKREMVLDYAEYLTNSALENSSYSFSTETFKGTIYNRTASHLNLTIYNYSMVVSILDDIADWYVLEFGGNA